MQISRELNQIVSAITIANDQCNKKELYRLKNEYIKQTILETGLTTYDKERTIVTDMQQIIVVEINSIYEKTMLRKDCFDQPTVYTEIDNDLIYYGKLIEQLKGQSGKEKTDSVKYENKTESENEKKCNANDCQKIAFKICTVCRKARYCSVDCQRKDWDKHKVVCHRN